MADSDDKSAFPTDSRVEDNPPPPVQNEQPPAAAVSVDPAPAPAPAPADIAHAAAPSPPVIVDTAPVTVESVRPNVALAALSIPDAISSILSGDDARVLSGATCIKTFAMKDEGEAACVAAGACAAISQQISVAHDVQCVVELGKALVNTASSPAGFSAYLEAGVAAALVKQLATPGLALVCVQQMCKAVSVLSFERTGGQNALVAAGIAAALLSHLKQQSDAPTLLRVAQAISSLVSDQDACKSAFIRGGFAPAIVPHLTVDMSKDFRDCFVHLIVCAARISTLTDGKHELLKANVSPAIVSLLDATDEDVCALVACTAARLAIVDEGDEALSNAGIASAITKRLTTCTSVDTLLELAKIIGNIASNAQFNQQYCIVDITLPLAKSLADVDVPPPVLRQVLRAMSAIASVEGIPSPEGQKALLQADAPEALTKLLHICKHDDVVIEVVRAMRLCATDFPDARAQMQALGALQALHQQLEKQVDIKIAAEIYSAAMLILDGGEALSLAPAPVDHRTFLQKLLCYPNRIKVEPPSADRKWNLEAGLQSINPRIAAAREKAGNTWAQPISLSPDQLFGKWNDLRDVGMGVLSKSSVQVKWFGVLMSKRSREALIFCILAILVTLYAVLMLDSESAYFLKHNLESQMTAEFPCTNVSNYAKTFDDIQDADEIFMWLQGVTLPFFYSGSNNHRPQCMCQTEDFVTCAGPHGTTNTDISASRAIYSINATSKEWIQTSVDVKKRGLPFLAAAICSDEGSAGNAAISYTVTQVKTVNSASRFYTSGNHYLRNGDPFRWVAPNTSRIPTYISQHLGRTLYVRDADGSNVTAGKNWFEVSLSPRCLAQPCPSTEFATSAINLLAAAAVANFETTGDAPALVLYLDRPCLPETPCMSECGKRECACNEAHGFSNISKLNQMPPAAAGPILGNNIFLRSPRLRNSVVKPSTQCSYPKSFTTGFTDGICWPEFSSVTTQDSGDTFVQAYTAAFGQPDADALKWLSYTAPTGSTFLPSNTDLLRFYGSGGFIMDFPLNDYEAARRMLHQAKTIGWWNRNSSRALSLEFALYNPNVNRFITAQYLLESPFSSGMIRGVLWRHSTLTPWSRSSSFAGLIIQYVMFGMNFFIVWHLRMSYKQLGAEKFFEDGFMIVNVVISVLLLVALCISIYVLVETGRVIVLNPSSMQHHVVFQLVYWDGQVANLFSVIAWLIWVRVTEFLDIFSPKTKILQKVLIRSSADIAVFSSVFIVYLMGFALSRIVAMGSMSQSFRTVNAALNTELMEIFVSYDYVAFREANPVMGPLYFVVFTLVIVLLMVNMLAAIVERFVGLCKEESESTANTSDQDMADYSRRLLKFKVQQVLRRGAEPVRDNWLEMWAKEGALFQQAGIMSVEELISAADLNCDGNMSMEEFLDFIKKNAEKNEEAMYQANSKDETDFLLSKIRARYDAIEAEQRQLALLLRTKVADS